MTKHTRVTDLAVTQFISCLFFGAGFALALWRDGDIYNPSVDGFGALSARALHGFGPVALQNAFGLLLIFVFIFVNAWRYYLSFWFVEESKAFAVLRGGLSRWRQNTEWLLRCGSLLALYLMQICFSRNGRHTEVLLAIVFGLLFIWDIFIYRAAKAAIKAETAKGKVDERELTDFTRRVWWWNILEGSGFLAASVYAFVMIIPDWSSQHALPTTLLIFAIGFLTFAFMAIEVADFIINRDKYLPLVVPVLLGTVGAFFATVVAIYH